MAHNADAMLVFCMDFRFQDDLNSWMQEQGLSRNCDKVLWPGSTQEIAQGVNLEGWKKVFNVSAKLHGVNRIVLMHHQDCGAYGGVKAFESQEAEDAKAAS